MSLTVRPDPKAPAGGHALLELPGGTLAGGQTRVELRESYGGRWLGPDRWQGERHRFGPYPVERDGGVERVRLGPEIVDRIEEFTPLRIALDGAAFDVIWPDTVRPRAPAATAGGIFAPAPPPPEAQPAPPSGPAPEPASEPVPEPAPEPGPEPAPEAAPGAPPARRGGWWLVAALLLLLVLAAAGWWWYGRRDGDAQEAAVPPAAEDTAEDGAAEGGSAAPGCGYAALSGLAGGFAAVERGMRRCGAALAPEDALRLIEDAAARDDPAALALFGVLYDGARTDARIERTIGLSFGDDPAKAAGYYARALRAADAASAGVDDEAGGGGVAALARPALAAVCARLRGAEGTLEKGAFDDYCG